MITLRTGVPSIWNSAQWMTNRRAGFLAPELANSCQVKSFQRERMTRYTGEPQTNPDRQSAQQTQRREHTEHEDSDIVEGTQYTVPLSNPCEQPRMQTCTQNGRLACRITTAECLVLHVQGKRERMAEGLEHKVSILEVNGR